MEIGQRSGYSSPEDILNRISDPSLKPSKNRSNQRLSIFKRNSQPDCGTSLKQLPNQTLGFRWIFCRFAFSWKMKKKQDLSRLLQVPRTTCQPSLGGMQLLFELVRAKLHIRCSTAFHAVTCLPSFRRNLARQEPRSGMMNLCDPIGVSVSQFCCAFGVRKNAWRAA